MLLWLLFVSWLHLGLGFAPNANKKWLVKPDLLMSYWNFEDGPAKVILQQLRPSLKSTDDRSTWLKTIVGFPERVPWEHVKTVIAYSLTLKPEWTFGLYDELLTNILAGYYDESPERDAALTEELDKVLEQITNESDILAMNLMIQSVIEQADEEREYEEEVTVINRKAPPQSLAREVLDKSRYLKETYENRVKESIATLPVIAVDAASDKKRRAAAFRTLCLLRFVRQGLQTV